MIVEVICGSIVTITISSLYFAKWILAREDRLDKEEEIKFNPTKIKLRCSELKTWFGGHKIRCELDDGHHGPHYCENNWWKQND